MGKSEHCKLHGKLSCNNCVHFYNYTGHMDENEQCLTAINEFCQWHSGLLNHVFNNWRALWKNRICSTTMKLRKSPVKSVTWQNISSWSVLSPEIVTQDAFNVILWTSTDVCIVHDDLEWKNRTTRYNPYPSIYSFNNTVDTSQHDYKDKTND